MSEPSREEGEFLLSLLDDAVAGSLTEVPRTGLFPEVTVLFFVDLDDSPGRTERVTADLARALLATGAFHRVDPEPVVTEDGSLVGRPGVEFAAIPFSVLPRDRAHRVAGPGATAGVVSTLSALLSSVARSVPESGPLFASARASARPPALAHLFSSRDLAGTEEEYAALPDRAGRRAETERLLGAREVELVTELEALGASVVEWAVEGVSVDLAVSLVRAGLTDPAVGRELNDAVLEVIGDLPPGSPLPRFLRGDARPELVEALRLVRAARPTASVREAVLALAAFDLDVARAVRSLDPSRR